jgi:cobalt-zinc-cadmium efflux system membrane fusion protein
MNTLHGSNLRIVPALRLTLPIALGLALAIGLTLGWAGCGGRGKPGDHESREAAAGGDAHDAPGHEEHGNGEAAEGHEDHGHEDGGHEGGHPGGGPAPGGEEGLVTLSPAQREAARITIASVSPRDILLQQELPGEIVVNADRLAHIVPRFSGIAREVRKNLGEPVRAGEVLAVIESDESLALYEVKSLIAGTAIEKHITLGEHVSDQQDIYVVADLSSVWANVTVYSRDLERIRVGQTATIEATGISERVDGRIDYVGPVVGEATRTSIARIVLPNPRRTWRPGLFVTAHVRTELVSARMAVRDEAIQSIRGRSVVFVEDGDGFRTHEVEVGRTDGEWTEILSGLSPGDRVAVENSFVLKSELLKSEAGHGHAH